MAPPEAPAGRRGIRFWLAIGLGVGYAPVAPGTFGSLIGVALAWALQPAGRLALGAAVLVVAALGFWSAGEAARRLGRKDPGAVVIDEIAGQLLTLLFVPPGAVALLLGFLLFRVADIVKPPPARRLESLPGGSGIMADDLVAGLYAGLVLLVVVRLIPS